MTFMVPVITIYYLYLKYYIFCDLQPTVLIKNNQNLIREFRPLLELSRRLDSDVPLPFDLYNNTTTSQCGSCFRGVWEDPAIGNLTSTGIPTHTEVDFKRPTKKVL